MSEKDENVIIKLHKVDLPSDKEEKRKRRKPIIIASILVIIFFGVGVLLGTIISNKTPQVISNSTLANKINEIKYYLKEYWLYVNDVEDIDKELENKALYGMTTFKDDPYTTYMSQEELDSFSSSINMNYVGIGAQYIYQDDVATITKVFKDSPAEKGGLMAGDVISAINGEGISGLTSDEIKNKITGEEGTSVKITVNRAGANVELEFVRGSIDSTVYAEAKDDYVLLEIMSFGKSTVEECVKYLDEYKDYKKLIIDLRGNSGGYQDALEYIAGLFLGENKVVLNETFNTGETQSYYTRVLRYYDNFEHIVVLTNGSTASAAEVLTITLKESHPDCIQVGETTYGKGVVQSTVILSDDSCLKFTTSYWTSPNGVSINKNGVVPDVEVKLDDLFYSVVYAMEDDTTFEVDDVSSYISIAQKCLNYLGYNTNRNDGYFDVSTYNAIKQFEEDFNLTADGIIENETYEALVSRVIYEYNVDPSKDVQMLKAIEILRNK